MARKPNVIVVMSDTLRTAELGCYGSVSVSTPNIDAFAGRSLRFTRAYPESLPTIPVRRAMHTGRRAYPFRNYRPVKWDIVYLPGWQAIDNDEDTLAENLVAEGYQTGFATDTLPYFAPGFNFERGFWQWEHIRGQQQDRWRSPYMVPDERLARYGEPDKIKENIHSLIPMHLANTAHVQDEEDTSTARTFQWGMNFLEDNAGAGEPFYLLVDCFDPHEPWEAPEKYYRMYGDPDYDGRRLVHCGYAPADKLGYTAQEVRFVHDQYCGLVSLVDEWFGRLMRKLDELALAKDTYVFFISDHGTNFCDNPANVIGKPAYALYPGVMQLPLLVRTPDEAGAGGTCNELVYNIDVVGTIYDVTGATSQDGIHGHSLAPLLTDTPGWQPRSHVTTRYGDSLCCIDDETWAITDIDRRAPEMFDLSSDPHCQHNAAGTIAPERFDALWQRLLDDAGGEFPDYRRHEQTDAIGQRKLRR